MHARVREVMKEDGNYKGKNNGKKNVSYFKRNLKTKYAF